MNAIDAIGWTLLHFLWQGALIGGIYAVLRAHYRRPETRYLLGIAALALCALILIVTLCWLWPSQPLPAFFQRLPDRLASNAGFATSADAWHRIDVALPWMVALWCAGVALLGARSVRDWWRLVRARRGAIRVNAWSERIEALAARFGVRRSISLLATAAVDAPTLLGIFKPAILLPTSLLLRLPPEQLELILAHELCHVRRWDYLVNLIQVAMETVLFYHPVVHWLSARVRADRELCCDQAVLAKMGAPPRRYAEVLAELAETASNLAPAANGGVLIERIEILLAPRAQRAPGAWLPLFSLVGVLLLAFGVKQALQPAALETRLNTPLRVATASATDVPTPRSVVEQKSVGKAALPAEHRVVEAAPTARLPAKVRKTTAVVPHKPIVAAVSTDSTNKNSYASEPARSAEPRVARSDREAAPAAMTPDHPAAAPIPLVATQLANTALDPTSAPAHTSATATPTPTAPAAMNPDRSQPAAESAAAPRVAHFVAPEYPVTLSERAVHGRVDLQFRIAADGSVQDVAVLTGGDHPQLARAAVSALKQWRFAPESVQTGHVYRQAIDFDLPDGAEPCRVMTGSHICRRDLGDAAAGVTVITR
jgi:bla regulator protein BlaR1